MGCGRSSSPPRSRARSTRRSRRSWTVAAPEPPRRRSGNGPATDPSGDTTGPIDQETRYRDEHTDALIRRPPGGPRRLSPALRVQAGRPLAVAAAVPRRIDPAMQADLHLRHHPRARGRPGSALAAEVSARGVPALRTGGALPLRRRGDRAARHQPRPSQPLLPAGHRVPAARGIRAQFRLAAAPAGQLRHGAPPLSCCRTSWTPWTWASWSSTRTATTSS